MSPQVSIHTETRRDGGEVATLTFNGRTSLNVLGQKGMVELREALANLAQNQACRLVILTGEGDKSFIGGVDLQEMVALDQEKARPFITQLHQCCQAIRNLPMPIIAKVQGYCLGGGLEVAAACDFRVAAAHAQFGMPEVKVGLPSVIEAALLPQLIGWGKTRELVLVGHMIDAQEAQACGLVERVALPGKMEQVMEEVVGHICEAGPKAVRLQKELLKRWEALPLEEAIEVGIDYFARAFQTDEPQRMMQKFFEGVAHRRQQAKEGE